MIAVRRWTWILGLVLAGCVSSDSGGNGGSDGNDDTERCASLSEEWRAAWRTLENRCSTAADCMVVGEPGSCDCAPTVTGDCGVAAARASYVGSEAERLAQQFAEGCTFPSICACAGTVADCSPEGQCVFTNQFCPGAAGEAGEAGEEPGDSSGYSSGYSFGYSSGSNGQ